MANENQEKKLSALEQLKELNKADKNKSGLDFEEPELQSFNATSIFEIDETDEPEHKPFVFGKRSQRKHSEVKVKSTAFENEGLKVEDVMVANGLKKGERYTETPVIPMEEQVSSYFKQKEESQAEVMESPEEGTSKESKVDVTEEQEAVQEESNEKEAEEPIVEKMEESVEDTTESNLVTEEELVEEEDNLENEDKEEEEQEDLYREKKSFLLSQYEKMQKYLEEQSNEGYHLVRQAGKKFYFREGEPKDYYYSVNYFYDEPDPEQWSEWEMDGWKLISRNPSKSKKEAGWFIFRNEEVQGEYRKEIDNDEEKFRFFKKYSNSCRSTLFLIFICMLCCLVAGFLQYMFQGYLISIVACGVLFLIALIVFIMYERMLISSKKVVRKLKARVRLKEREFAMNDYQDDDTLEETQEELDTDWNQLEEEISKSRHRRR